MRVFFLITGVLLGSAPVFAASTRTPEQRAFQVCVSCHSIDPANNDTPGPNLAGVIGRPIASVRGYDYTPAMKAFAAKEGTWSAELIEQFVQDPLKMVPGTRMEPPPGVENEALRKSVLQYLVSFSSP